MAVTKGPRGCSCVYGGCCPRHFSRGWKEGQNVISTPEDQFPTLLRVTGFFLKVLAENALNGTNNNGLKRTDSGPLGKQEHQISYVIRIMGCVPDLVFRQKTPTGAALEESGLFSVKCPASIIRWCLLHSVGGNGLTSCRMRTESEPSCGSPVVSGDPKEDHNYSSAKSSNARSTSPASDSVSSSSADDHYEFAAKGSQEGSEGSFQSHESHSETEEDDRKRSPKEAKDALGDSGYASQHKKRQHFAKARKVPSDTLPLKKRRTEKPPESDDEEMKEAAGSLLHLAGIRSCLNNITNRTAKGQKEQKETTKN
ncbi:hypothetical protein CB1_001889005 [Camelus ferus]|nr:hypothetical protein CB1_001889005 [Camelus ferus]